MSVFISNLKPDIGQYLRLFQPLTLVDGFRLARKVESIVLETMKRTTYHEGVGGQLRPLLPNIKPIPALTTSSTTGGLKSPVESLSQSEMDEGRRKRLCFWCASKYTPGHKCTKSQLYQLVIEVSLECDAEPKIIEDDEFQDCKK